MDPTDARTVITRLLNSAEAVAALGVHFGGLCGDVAVPADLAVRVAAVAEALVGDTHDVDPDQARLFASLIRALLGRAAAFAAQPDQPAQWAVTDPVVLQSLGQASAVFAPYIRDRLAPTLDGMSASLAAPGAAMLDVGVGVGALAIALAQCFPAARVVGIDIWEPSLALARGNVARAGVADRVELRHQNVLDLDDPDTYDLVWFAGPFIPGDVQPGALATTIAALRPGGWMVYGAFAGNDPLTSAMADLRTLQSGGPVLSGEEVVARLERAGLHDVHTVSVDLAIPSLIVVGRKR